MTEKLHGYFSVQLNDRFNCALFSALQFSTSFAAGVPVSAVPVISVAGAVAAVPKDPPSRVRYAIVCSPVIWLLNPKRKYEKKLLQREYEAESRWRD